MASNFEFRIPSLLEKELNKLNILLNKLKSDLLLFNLDENQTTNVVQLIKDLVNENKNSIDYLLKNTATTPEKIVGDVLGNSIKYFESIDSQYKR